MAGAGQPKPAFLCRRGAGRRRPDRVCGLSQRRPRTQGSRESPEADQPRRAGGRGTGRERSAGVGRVERERRQHHDRQGVQVQAGLDAARREGHLGLQAAGRQHRPLRPQRLGRLGADHPGQRRLQGRQGLEDARRQGVQGRAGADRQSGGDARRLRRRRCPHRLGHARHGAALHGRASSTRPASRATAGSCRASISRSTGPTAATASSSARASRPWPTCAARSWCSRRTRRRTTSR